MTVLRRFILLVACLVAGLQDFILVSMSYAQGESGRESRNRDYTPAATEASASTRPRQPRPGYGQVKDDFEFPEHEVVPMVEKGYRADPARRIYVGHSYGSLLGLHVLFNRPACFSHCTLGSPSLWYDGHPCFRCEHEYAKTSRSLPASVRFFVGEYESIRKRSSRHDKEEDLVADLKRCVAQVRSHRSVGLDMGETVLAEEDHATVFPALVTRGLAWALPSSANRQRQ
jgi:hypothetical protein